MFDVLSIYPASAQWIRKGPGGCVMAAPDKNTELIPSDAADACLFFPSLLVSHPLCVVSYLSGQKEKDVHLFPRVALSRSSMAYRHRQLRVFGFFLFGPLIETS